jgi:hypothetical protein
MKLVIALCVLSATADAGSNVPRGFEIVAGSTSPDGKLAVIAPDADHVKDGVRQNGIIDVATGKIVATIAADTTMLHQNNTDFAPKWAKDGSWLLWEVDGKWGTTALVLVQVEQNAVKRQIDLREPAVKRALAEAKKADPKHYAGAKKYGEGDGAWFRDGFAIEVVPVDRTKVALPMRLAIELTSNPKGDDPFPADADLSGKLTATVAADGTIGFGTFVVTPPQHAQP